MRHHRKPVLLFLNFNIFVGLYMDGVIFDYKYLLCVVTVHAVAMDCIVFIRVFFLYAQDKSWSAALNLMKFCMNMFHDIRMKPR